MRKILIIAVLVLAWYLLKNKVSSGIGNPASIPNIPTIKSVAAAPQPVVSVMPEAADPLGSRRLNIMVTELNAQFFKVGDRVKLIGSVYYPMTYTIVKSYSLDEWHCFVLNTLYVGGEVLKIVKV